MSCTNSSTGPDISELDDFIEIGQAEIGPYANVDLVDDGERDCTHRIKVNLKRAVYRIFIQVSPSGGEDAIFSDVDAGEAMIEEGTLFYLNKIKGDQEIYIYRTADSDATDFNVLTEFTIDFIGIQFFDVRGNFIIKIFLIDKTFTDVQMTTL